MKAKSGFTLLEYLALIAFAVTALLVMQFALVRAVSGKWKESADRFGHGRQYEIGATEITEQIIY